MKRRLGYGSLVLAAACALAGGVIGRWTALTDLEVRGVQVEVLASKLLLAAAVAFATYGVYLLTTRVLRRVAPDKRREHDVRNVVRLIFLAVGAIAVLGVATERWVGVLFSLGVVGFAVTFALQQPLFSLMGWVYIMLNRPYQVGDRVKIREAKGDVVDVDFLVTTLWEVEGDLVSSHQPSGRVVTIPNSTVLSEEVYNYTREEFPYVWNELTIQLSYETDLAFATEEVRRIADEYLGDEMERNVDRYREELAETPVDLQVNPRPSVNVYQRETWVELRVRYLADPRAMAKTRNELYRRIVARFHEEPDRVSYPVGRSR